MKKGVDMEALYKIIEALSPPRIEILRLLLDNKPRYVSEIAKAINLSRTATAYHLDVLEDIGLVVHEYKVIKEPSSTGKLGSFYRINWEKLKEVLETLEKLQKLFAMASSQKVKTEP